MKINSFRLYRWSSKNSTLLVVCLLLFNSCARYKDLVILDEGPEFSTTPEAILNKRLPIIQPNDVLYITVEADDPEGLAAKPFNRGVTQVLNGNATQSFLELTGYLVDSLGYIDFPVLGSVRLQGLNTLQAKDTIVRLLYPYINKPIVNIRYSNFRINIIGEVVRPGTYLATNERLTIFEALSQAGGISNVGNSSNILIIREENNQREYGRINLKSRDVFNSPYYYLHQYDVIYVEPLETKISTVRDPAQRYLPWISALTSVFAFLIAILSN